MRNNLNQFYDGLEKLNIKLDEAAINKFVKYYNMLIETNRVMNLTAITDPVDVINKHFIDSLSIVKCISLDDNKSIIDIGTGAGFPGIPLKIAFPDLNITLLDSLNKRINFLNNVIEELDLTDIKAVHGRSEEFGRNKNYREKYDIAVSRAVANLSTLSEYCLPFVKVGGLFIPYKSGNSNEEIKEAENAIKILGGKHKENVDFCLENTDISRTLVVIEKVKNTSSKFPRKSGTPSREPIR